MKLNGLISRFDLYEAKPTCMKLRVYLAGVFSGFGSSYKPYCRDTVYKSRFSLSCRNELGAGRSHDSWLLRLSLLWYCSMEQEPEEAWPTVTLVKVLVLPELPNCRNNISQHFQHAKNGPSPISFITVRAGPERSGLVHGTVTRIALLRPLHSRVSAIIAPRRWRYLSYARSLPQSRLYALR